MEAFPPITLILGLLILFGLLLGLFASRIGFPRVAAYVIAGIIFSPDLLGNVFKFSIGPWADTLTTISLGIIAYLIGGSFTVPQFRRIGKMIFSIALWQSFGAVLCVFLAIFLLGPIFKEIHIIPLALAFASIAATTAPAGTIAVLHQYRAHGPVSSLLLATVALDDAIGIILFSVMLSFTAGESLINSLGEASFEIGTAVLMGAISGKILALFCKHIRQGGLRFPVILGSILFVVGLAEAWSFSPLLACMSLGFLSRYFLGAGGDHLFAPIEYFEELVFIIFFTLAGAHFSINVFHEHWDLILLYFFARVIGKLAGASLGAYLTGAPRNVTCWIGFGLIPQAGVAVGLALTLGQQPVFREMSIIIVNVILATTLIYELVGPLFVKFGLSKAGEISLKEQRPRTRPQPPK